MKERHKAYIKINIVSIVLTAVSFISITLAWFAYSGISSVQTEVGVKAWSIKLKKGDTEVTHNIPISLSSISPGMTTLSETINIRNEGDSDATLKYEIVSVRILDNDNYVIGEGTTTEEVEDLLSHYYPFHINMGLEKNYILSKKGETSGEETAFKVSVSWPLDSPSDNDGELTSNEKDSLWGGRAYDFSVNEQNKKISMPDYQVKPSIQIVINVTAEQYVSDESTASDTRYNMGEQLLFDVNTMKRCTELGGTCIKTYIIDSNNTIGDETVTLLPDPMSTHQSGLFTAYNTLLTSELLGWNAVTEALTTSDILKVISTDIIDSYEVLDNYSDSVIGNLKYGTRMNTSIAKIKTAGGYYKFLDSKFNYILSANCYWVNDGDNIPYAVIKDNTQGKLYKEVNTSKTCNVIPKILANKQILESTEAS